nr:MAG TPA: hypothetical protein [Caudoviricetes sp.]
MPIAWALASTCFLNCLCSLVLVLLTAFLLPLVCFVLGGGASQPPARRAPPPSNTTLLASFFSSLLFHSLLFFFFFCFGMAAVV